MENTQTKWETTILNPDFYPTPENVIEMMEIDCRNQIVYEPSAGSGNILEWLKLNGAKEVIFSEINEDLASICKAKARFIGHDFLKIRAEEISHVNLIVMNPPFSNDEAHILHAWNIAPDGCEIISLCNSTILESNGRGYRKESLKYMVENYGQKINLGQCFSFAERRTNVNVTLVKLYKPCFNQATNFEGFYMDAEPETEQVEGIIKFNEIKALVNSYMTALNCFDKFSVVANEMSLYTSHIGFSYGLTCTISHNETTIDKAVFAKNLQKSAWKNVFNKMKLEKYLTSGVMKDINNFVETQTKIPFTVKNIYRMFEIIVGTKEHNFNRALVEAIDNFTMHTNENRYGVEGWKTNAGYMLNKKFISGWIAEPNWSKGIGIKRWGANFERVLDLTKVLCSLTGKDYNNINSIIYSSAEKDQDGNWKKLNPHSNTIVNENCFEANKWYDWGFFEFKVYKKGTGHFKFKNISDWEYLNRKYAEIKGQVLPEKL